MPFLRLPVSIIARPGLRRPLWRLVRAVSALAVVVAVGANADGAERANVGQAKDGPTHTLAAGIRTQQMEFRDEQRSNWQGTGPRVVRVTVLDAGATLPADGVKRPLILVSHGSGGNAAQMAWLTRPLAEHGYIVAAIDHNGTAEEERHSQPITFTDFFNWERPRDVRFVLTELLQDPAVGPAIDPERVGVAGFSLGGTTALWVVGARLDQAELARRSPAPPQALVGQINAMKRLAETDPQVKRSAATAEQSFQDTRIKAVFALAPAMGVGFRSDSLKEIRVPVALVSGDADLINSLEENARQFADGIPGATLTVLPGERGHYLGPIAEAQREKEMAEVAELAVGFFNGVFAR